jgi:F-box-like
MRRFFEKIRKHDLSLGTALGMQSFTKEIWFEIFKYLDQSNLSKAELTCKYWNQLINSENNDFYLKDYKAHKKLLRKVSVFYKYCLEYKRHPIFFIHVVSEYSYEALCLSNLLKKYLDFKLWHETIQVGKGRSYCDIRVPINIRHKYFDATIYPRFDSSRFRVAWTQTYDLFELRYGVPVDLLILYFAQNVDDDIEITLDMADEVYRRTGKHKRNSGKILFSYDSPDPRLLEKVIYRAKHDHDLEISESDYIKASLDSLISTQELLDKVIDKLTTILLEKTEFKFELSSLREAERQLKKHPKCSI